MTLFHRFLSAFVLIFLGAALVFAPGPCPAFAQTATPVASPSAASVASTPTAAPKMTAPKMTAPAAPLTINRSGTPAQKLQSFGGWVAFVLICFGIGKWQNPKLKPMLRTVLWGMGLQVLFGAIVLFTPKFFVTVNGGVDALLSFSREGGKFLFGNLVDLNVPVNILNPTTGATTATTMVANTGALFAFNVLPTIIFFSALSTLLYYLNILQPIVRGLSWIMQRSMGTSGSETLSAAANIFLGQTEAPLFVRPFLANATKSELMAIMVGGFSNIASGVLGAYVGMLKGFEPEIAGHLISASIISAPASLVVAKLLLPESEVSETASTQTKVVVEQTDANVIDSAARGALEGLQLALNVGAMLLVFVALVAMLNAILGWVGHFVGLPQLSLQFILGYIFAPFAWLLGIPWEDCLKSGGLLGVKTAVNEFVAYLDLAAKMGADRNYLDSRSFLLTAYALCGFANFSSIAIQIGGIGGMAPNRRHELSKIGLISMFGGAIASCMTACVVGFLL